MSNRQIAIVVAASVAFTALSASTAFAQAQAEAMKYCKADVAPARACRWAADASSPA
jgi:hypothetical protein